MMLDPNAIDPYKFTQLAMTANPFPVLSQMTISPTGMPPAGPAKSMLGDAIYGGMPAPGMQGMTQQMPQQPGVMTPQQMAALQGMMGAAGQQRMPSAGVGSRPGQVKLEPVATTQRPKVVPSLGQSIYGGR